MPGAASKLRPGALPPQPDTPGVATRGAGEMLALIRGGRASTRAELVEETGLARSTIAQRVDALLRRGYTRQDTEKLWSGNLLRVLAGAQAARRP